MDASHELTAGAVHRPGGGFFDLFPDRVAVVMVDFQNDFCSPRACGAGPVTNTHNAEAAQRATFSPVTLPIWAHAWSTLSRSSTWAVLLSGSGAGNGQMACVPQGRGGLSFSLSLSVGQTSWSNTGSTAGRARRSPGFSKAMTSMGWSSAGLNWSAVCCTRCLALPSAAITMSPAGSGVRAGSGG